MITNPSELVCASLALDPADVGGTVLEADSACERCGQALVAGTVGVRSRYSNSFTNDFDLAARTGVACQACIRVCDNEILSGFAVFGSFRSVGTVFTTDGFYTVSTDAARAQLILEPPPPPFLVTIAASRKQHLIWRTPVSLSRDFFYVRLGNHLLSVRRPMLLRALQAIRTYQAAQHWRSPFKCLDRSLSHPAHGQLRVDEIPPALRLVLNELGSGELWALTALVKDGIEAPTPTPLVRRTLAQVREEAAGRRKAKTAAA